MMPLGAPNANGAGRLLKVLALGSLVVLAYAVPFLLTNWPSQPGDDWLWYRNGFDRLASGAPLYEPSWLNGPYDYLGQGNVYQWNQPPWMLPLTAPFALLPNPFDKWGWSIAMIAAVVTAVVIAVPSRIRGTALMIWPPTAMAIVWGNVECLVVLGISLWIVGLRRSQIWLEAIGIVFASIKVVPAIPLLLLAAHRRRWRPIALAVVIWAGLVLPAVVLRGVQVVPDFVTAASNIRTISSGYNISPVVWLGLPLEIVRIVASLGVLAAVLLRPTWLALTASETAVAALPNNPYVDWLIPAALAVASRPTSGSTGGHGDVPIMEYSADASP